MINGNTGLDAVSQHGLLMSCVCAMYRLWLSEMLRMGGPADIDSVAWFLVRTHTECPFCRDNKKFMAEIECAETIWQGTHPGAQVLAIAAR